MLPGLNIKFDNGNIGTVVSTADGVFGLLASAVAVVDKFELEKEYTVNGMADVAALGILPDVDNYGLYKWLKEFYEEAGEGAELWIMGFPKANKPSDWFTPDVVTGKAPAEKLLDASNGRLNGLFTSFTPEAVYVPVIETALDADVALAQQKAQLLAVNYTKNRYTPLFVILEGFAFDGDAISLPDLLQGEDNRVGIFIGDTEKRTDAPVTLGAATGVIAGRLSKIPVQENPGAVKRGALATLNAFILDEKVEQYNVEALHNKGFITFRTHERKAGYYISDDPLATGADDDYSNISLRRVIDKAYRVAHNIASEEILADFDLNNDGTISPFYAKTIEGNIEQEVFNQMTSKGQLSRDQSNKDDKGAIAKFNTTLNVAQNNRIELSLKVRPKGYARWFDVLLGYDVSLNN